MKCYQIYSLKIGHQISKHKARIAKTENLMLRRTATGVFEIF